MSIQILARHAMQFDHPTDENVEPVIVKYQEIASVPDWVAESSMFKAAQVSDWVAVIDGNFRMSTDNVAEARVLRAEDRVSKDAKKAQ